MTSLPLVLCSRLFAPLVASFIISSGCDIADRLAPPAPAPVVTAVPPPPTLAPAIAAAPAVPTPPPVAVGRPTTGGSDIVVDVYKRVSPGVVLVTSSNVGTDFFQQPTPPRSGTGSGFIIDRQGYIVTNSHVVEDATKLEVSLPDNAVVPAALIGRDPWFDLAVIKVEVSADRLQTVALGDSDQAEIGELVIAIGNPFGLERTVTTGVLSARRPAVSEPNGVGVLVDAIQTDASINPGNSGGPLLNSRGEVIGVNTLARLGVGGAPAGINFAIPINAVKRIVPELIASGVYKHPFLGVGTTEITESMAEELSLPVREGLMVQSVTPNTGAAAAGVRAATTTRSIRSREVGVGGDIIVAVDGQPVRRSPDMLVYLERNKHPGETVALSIVRDGQRLELTVRVGERPLPQGQPQR